jgi:oligopeptide/dipeptide ABC transporter ATP-binding protein
MRQRVMIAMAIACEPRLLFADEPTTALDVTVQAQILELISDLRRQLNMSMVIITHDLGVVANHTDRVAVMYAGELVELADTKELFSRPRMPYTEALMNSIPRLDREPGSRLPSIAGSTPDPTTERTSCGFASRCKYATDKCRNEHPELTDDGNGHLYRCFFPLGGN